MPPSSTDPSDQFLICLAPLEQQNEQSAFNPHEYIPTPLGEGFPALQNPLTGGTLKSGEGEESVEGRYLKHSELVRIEGGHLGA